MAACWACPALPMLPLPLKETGRVSFLGVKPMISAHYEENPDSFHEEIKQLDQLRENAMRPSRDYNGISTLRRYFAQLHLLRARFPPETIGQLPIDFVWKDIFSGAEYIQEGLQIEQASILYNISALHSALGCRSKRDLEQEIKESITHFQCAAGACNYLDEQLSMNHASKDISPPFIQFYKNLMLGQAQECFVEKSLRGSAKVKNSTIAKLSTRVAEYYSETLRCLETEPCSVIAKKHKDWPKLLKLKALYFQALSHYYQGDTCEETGQQGSMMAWHQLALKKLTAIGRVPKNLGEGTVLKEAIKNFSEHVQAKLAVSKKQNEQVYHERIPDLETLESFSGTDLVKPVVFHPTDSKNLGTDIFGRLVPMRAYEASSIYSERKADMLRSITSSVSEKDEELERFLKTLNIEEVESINKGPPDISGEVLEQHKQLQGKSLVVKKLHADLQELMGYSEMVKKDLQDISKHRMEDEEEEKEFQRKFGPRPASQVCASMWKDLETYKRYHEQGSKSNTELKAMFDQHYQYLVLLSGPLPSLQAAIPRMTPMDAPEEDARDSDRWKGLLAKIGEMQQQRKMLTCQLRGQISSDDITKNLVGHIGTEADTFIEKQMKKHREVADLIQQNLAAQENILSAVVDANAGNVKVRQAVQDLNEQQESMFNSLVKAGKYFTILQEKIREGIGFYSRIHDNVSKLRKRVVDVTETRSRERKSTERQRSVTPTSPPPSQPSSSAVPPPRPPKKAELAGNPLTSSHDSSSNQISSLTSNQVSPLNQRTPEDNDKGTPNRNFNDSGGETLSPSMTMNMPGGFHGSDLTTPSSSLSLEEQLRELQRQQQIQLQSLGQSKMGPDVVPHPTNMKDTPPSVPQENQVPQFSPQVSPVHVPNVVSSHVPPSAVPTSPSDDNEEIPANQAILDLQLLLQPPDEDTSNLATPLQPESSIVTQPQMELNTSLPQPNNVVGQIFEPDIGSEPKPAHLQSQIQQVSSGTNSLISSPDVGLPLLLNNAHSQPPHSTAEIIEEGTGYQHTASEVDHSVILDQEVKDSKSVLISTLPPQDSSLLPGGHSPFHDNLNSVNFQEGPLNFMKSAENTIIINSLSRPIPAPILSPTSTQPELNQNENYSEPEQDQGQTVMEPEQDTEEETVISGQNLNSNELSLDSSDRENETANPILRSQNETSDPVLTQPSLHSMLVSGSNSLLANEDGAAIPLDLTSTRFQSLATISPVVSTPMSITGMEFNHGLDANLHSLPQLMDHPSLNPAFHSISAIGSTSLHTPPSISPLSLDTGSHATQMGNQMEHLQALLASNKTLQRTIEEKNKEIEQQKASIADQKSQLENYKQQLLVLQQQLSHVSLQQQKQEHEKATASGQQAVLMQLLQQQQGMFSQQQAQIENLSKVSDTYRKEQMESEVKYKQALTAEQEKNSTLVSQNSQQNQEIQKLQQQLQSNAQQYQMLQVHLYQYQTQIQERNKQLLAFRDQHKDIIQSLELKYQQKVSQLVQQIQELQGEVKKTSLQRQGIALPMQPMPAKTTPPIPTQQFTQVPRTSQHQQFVPQSLSTPNNAHPSINVPTTLPVNQQTAPPRTPNSSNSQVFMQPKNSQSPQRSVGLPPQPISNPMTPQQLPAPLVPQPAFVPTPLNQQGSGDVPQNISWARNQSPGNPSGAQVMNQGNQQQQFQPAPPQQVKSQPGHMAQGQQHMAQAMTHPPNQHMHMQPPSGSQLTVSSTPGTGPPQQMQNPQIGSQGVPHQADIGIQMPQQIPGIGQPQSGVVPPSNQYPRHQGMQLPSQGQFMGQGQPNLTMYGRAPLPPSQQQQQPSPQGQLHPPTQGYQQPPATHNYQQQHQPHPSPQAYQQPRH